MTGRDRPRSKAYHLDSPLRRERGRGTEGEREKTEEEKETEGERDKAREKREKS